MKTAIVLAAFGTTVPRARLALENIEKEYKSAFSDLEIRWAYTSDMVRRKIWREEGVFIDTPATALAKLQEEGYQNVIVQSLHIFPGQEYHDLNNIVESFAGLRDAKGKNFFHNLLLGKPLLYEYEDYLHVTEQSLKNYLPQSEDTALVLMGHGTEHFAFSTYGCLNDILRHIYKNVFLATVEGYPGLDHVQADLQKGSFKKINLLPFMVVAGDHSINDMAGDEEDSWKIVLQESGYEVDCILEGMGENKSVVNLFLAHTRRELSSL